MSRFLAKRLAGAFIVLVLVSLMSFAIIWLVPGDPTAAFLDTSATPEQVARLRRELGLDRRCRMQMLDWYGRVLQRRSRPFDPAQPQRHAPRSSSACR